MASFGFTKIPPESRKRERSPSEGESDLDTYQLCCSGKATRTHQHTKHYPEEGRMLQIGEFMARRMGVRPEQIKMHKELDARSGECKVHATVVSLEDEET